MKKLIIAVLTFVFTVNGLSQIKFNGYIEGGYYTHKKSFSNIYYENSESGFVNEISSQTYLNHMYIEAGFNVKYKGFNLEQTFFNIGTYKGSGYTITPLDIMYTTRLYYKWNVLQLGVEHMCTHPIISNQIDPSGVTYRESYDKIFLKFTFGNGQKTN